MAHVQHLHLTRAGLTSQRPGHAGTACHFAPDADGLARFATHLAEHRAHRLILLVDLPDEHFTTETLPPLAGRDRRALIARRRARIAGDSPFITLQPLPAPIDHDGNAGILFAAFLQPAQLTLWLDIIERSGTYLASMHSVPFAALALLPHLPPAPGNARLLASRGPAGLRVSCYVGTTLRFSRLTPADDGSWHTLVDEIQRTRQHLFAQRILTRDTPLQTLALLDTATDAPSGPGSDITRLELANLARQCGATDAASVAELLGHLLGRRHAVPGMQAPAVQRSRMFARAGHALALGAALAVGAAGVMAYDNLRHTTEAEADAALLEHQTRATQDAVVQLRAATPGTPLPPARIHDAHAQLDRLAAASRLSHVLHGVSQALDRHPDITLQRLDWAFDLSAASAPPTLQLHAELPEGSPAARLAAFTAALEQHTRGTASVASDGNTPAHRVILRLALPTSP